MLQRMQTVHLLVVVALMAVMFFPNYATVKMGSATPGTTEVTAADGTVVRTTTVAQDHIIFSLWGIYQNGEKVILTTYMGILVALTLVVAFVTIFLYRKRWLQVRLCFAMAIMLIGVEAFIAMYIYKLTQVLDAMQAYAIKYSVVDMLPIVALLFVYLAFRGITKDMALVKSLDRIR